MVDEPHFLCIRYVLFVWLSSYTSDKRSSLSIFRQPWYCRQTYQRQIEYHMKCVWKGAEAEALKNGVNRRCDFRAHCRRLADLANIDCEFYFLFARVGDGCVITHTSNTHRPYGKHVLRLGWKRHQRWRGDVGIFRLLGRSINCLCSQNVYSSACSYAGNIYIRATLSHNVAYVYRV